MNRRGFLQALLAAPFADEVIPYVRQRAYSFIRRPSGLFEAHVNVTVDWGRLAYGELGMETRLRNEIAEALVNDHVPFTEDGVAKLSAIVKRNLDRVGYRPVIDVDVRPIS